MPLAAPVIRATLPVSGIIARSLYACDVPLEMSRSHPAANPGHCQSRSWTASEDAQGGRLWLGSECIAFCRAENHAKPTTLERLRECLGIHTPQAKPTRNGARTRSASSEVHSILGSDAIMLLTARGCIRVPSHNEFPGCKQHQTNPTTDNGTRIRDYCSPNAACSYHIRGRGETLRMASGKRTRLPHTRTALWLRAASESDSHWSRHFGHLYGKVLARDIERCILGLLRQESRHRWHLAREQVSMLLMIMAEANRPSRYPGCACDIPSVNYQVCTLRESQNCADDVHSSRGLEIRSGLSSIPVQRRFGST
jgi:hypothetical protein